MDLGETQPISQLGFYSALPEDSGQEHEAG